MKKTHQSMAFGPNNENITNGPSVSRLQTEKQKISNNNEDEEIFSEEGENCCAGSLCGKASEGNIFICKPNIKHRCVQCKLAMHGGLCGAEASTIITDIACGSNSVVCFICIKKRMSIPAKGN